VGASGTLKTGGLPLGLFKKLPVFYLIDAGKCRPGFCGGSISNRKELYFFIFICLLVWNFF
jgi:hypothetical protein